MGVHHFSRGTPVLSSGGLILRAPNAWNRKASETKCWGSRLHSDGALALAFRYPPPRSSSVPFSCGSFLLRGRTSVGQGVTCRLKTTRFSLRDWNLFVGTREAGPGKPKGDPASHMGVTQIEQRGLGSQLFHPQFGATPKFPGGRCGWCCFLLPPL